MTENQRALLRGKLVKDSFAKLMALGNGKLHEFVADAVELCNPRSVFVCTDAREDIEYIRNQAIETGDEMPLAKEGHTVHFDGYFDQGRDKANTKYLVPQGVDLGANLNTADKRAGTAEVRALMKDIMVDRQMYVRFFCLGPTRSEFSIPGVQLTDSAYVAHSEDLLYRSGYDQFRLLGDSGEFFRVLHSSGETENHVSKNIDQRRIYIDLEDEIVYSANTQYGGNTIGFKKLALRFAICRADREGWLAEHMFVMAVSGPKERTSYFAGAFPSACGKTSTAMLPGERIIGDDIAYFRAINGQLRAVNVESGIFGIIRDVNAEDDPVIHNVLTSEGEVIFSNVLVNDEKPYWLGMGCEIPTQGVNHSGQWYAGRKDADGNEITASHRNARYTISLEALDNLDPKLNDPAGVPVSGVIFGGRDSDTSVPVQQSFDWTHGVITMGGSLESETTAATIGKEGVRAFNPMSNLDFVSIPLGRYLQNYLDFGNRLNRAPSIFAVNYFLKNDRGEYLNGMNDKRVWIKWVELLVHGEVGTLTAPTGRIPKYSDLKMLFRQVLNKDYTEHDYVEQFTIRIAENLRKIDRIEKIYRTQVADTPQILFDVLERQREQLLEAGKRHGEYVSPFNLQD